MADLNSLTINGVKYDTFPGRPYFVTVTQETVDETDYQNSTYSTTETVENLSNVIAAGLLPVARVIYIGPSGGHYEEFFVLSLVWYDADTGRYVPTRFTAGNTTLYFTENDVGGFDVTDKNPV